jgi:hypothetical protein
LRTARKLPVFTAAYSIDQPEAKSKAISPKKSASAAVITQSGFIQSEFIAWLGIAATASSFAAARASRAISVTAGACTAALAGDTAGRRAEGEGVFMVNLL